MIKGALLFTAGTAFGLILLPNLQTAAAAPQGTQSVRDFPNLQKGLMETPGCLGVQTFSVDGGKKLVIGAWFENRKAMEAWYYSKMHQEAMAKFFPGMGSKGGKPFAAFKDEKSPLLVIASVTPGAKAIGNGSNLAVSQIAIEGYAPIPGGLAFGGTFAPDSLKVPGMVRLSPEK
jgi:hypothetical protein